MNKKNIIITIISVLMLVCIFAFARTTTTDLGLVKPTWTEDIDILDDLNANSDILEAFANDPLKFDSDLERLEDRVGAMFTGNTETGITLTYQDADNTIDAVIGADDIVESMIKFVNLGNDEEIVTRETTTGDFEYHTLAELSIQPLDAGLTSIAGLTTAANDMIYTTALDTYAIMDTFAELQAVVADKTLVNEEDVATLDANWVNTTHPWADNEVSDTLTSSTCTGNASTVTTNANLTGIVTSTGNATAIANKAIAIAKLADGTDGELITWDASGVIATVPVGTATHVLTSGGTGVAPTFQAAGGGYTTFAEFDEESNWKVYYSDGSGDITELALGDDGTYLKSNGAAAAPTFSTPAGAGDVVKVGTPANSQVGVWTGDGTIEGAASLTYDGSNLQLTGDVGSTGTKITKGWFTDLEVVNAISGVGLVSASNADITIQPDGTGDTIIYAPADVVTTKTAVATLTIAEAGTVLVSCAAVPYTITLPTASGHTGLRYHFIKIDANYNLVTLDGDGAETFNYENSTSAPCLTYIRLNTYCAEVTIVSDGTNWQVINERTGQVPYVKAYLSAAQLDVTSGIWNDVELDTEVVDIGSNFNTATWVSGNATSTSTGHLVDSGGAFTEAMIGKRVKNTTDTTYTYVTARNSATDLTVRDDIFVDTEGYEIKYARFVAPVSGKYIFQGLISYVYTTVVTDEVYSVGLKKNDTTQLYSNHTHASLASYISPPVSTILPLVKDDYVNLITFSSSGVDTVDLFGAAEAETHLVITLISKD